MFSILCYAAALWPTWCYIVRRWSDGSDDPWGAASLICIVFLLLRTGQRFPVRSALPTLLLALYGISLTYGSPLITALIGLAGLGSLASSVLYGRSLHGGTVILHLLMTPLMASLNFYGGYPVRSILALFVATALRAFGFAVEASGTGLWYQDHIVLIDSPCGGIKLLWLGWWMSATLICCLELQRHRATLLFFVSSVATLTLNIGRLVSLFFTETKIIPASNEFHGEIGVFCSCLLALLLVVVATSFADSKERTFQHFSNIPGKRTWLQSACILVAAIQFVISLPAQATANQNQEVILPDRYEQHSLLNVGLSERDKQFAESFPGVIRRYRDGTREVLIRGVTMPTRQLHPSSDCLRGAGYSIDALPARRDAEGDILSCVRASRKDEVLRVCEKIKGSRGQSYSDASSWYWNAALGRSSGPWFAYSISESWPAESSSG